MKWEKVNTNRVILHDKVVNDVLLYNGYGEEILPDLEHKQINLEFNKGKVNVFIEYIKKFKESQEKVLVIADYDGDGDTSGAEMYKFLAREGINVDIVCLDRKVGFGMFSGTIDMIKEKYGVVKGLITTDNGSKSSTVINYAKEVFGDELKVIITDHHDKDEKIEETADLFFNPHYDDTITNERICGAMVVFTLINQYYKTLGLRTENIKFTTEMLELATVATYTDVMPVFKENRTALKFLINRVRKGTVLNKGLNALFATIKLDTANFTADDLGFKIGPILNASGRLTSSEVPTRLLIEEDYSKCLLLAKECVDTNKLRQTMTKELHDKIDINEDNNVHIMAYENAHEGLIGIIAGNICEETGGPSFAFTKVENGTYKGSGRSPYNYNLIKGATRVFNDNPDIVVAYGGHPGAIGLTLKDLNSVKQFEKFINIDFLGNNKSTDEVSKKYIDFPAGLDLSNIFIKLDSLEPYGEGLNKPIYKIKGKVSNPKIMAVRHMSFYVNNDEIKNSIKMNWFRHVEPLDCFSGSYDVYFTLTKNVFRGNTYYNGNVIEAIKEN